MKSSARILCIGHEDSSGASGIPLSTRVAAAYAMENSVAVTAVLWMSPTGRTVFKLPPRVVAGQLDAAAKGAAACCIGLLPSPETVRKVMRRIQRRNVPGVVLRPVVFDGEGRRLLCASGAGRLCGYLGACAGVVATEQNAWGMIAGGTLEKGEGAGRAARRLVELGAPMAMVVGIAHESAGNHGRSGDQVAAGAAVSVYDGSVSLELCAGGPAPLDEWLAAAAACCLAAGECGIAAFEAAARWVTRGSEWQSLSS
ncbi:MAG: bifunctional hydroxymethylpyrimidine kinase/phosphomethylpyrimidine kinase [Chloroflexi bacterium]|nr:bifunctional hydroxymethylpyrimidine kinase/phosphomethylpyrimidine kinase [Chloroflexota bacterium]